MTFFTELEQKISQFIWRHKRPQIAKAVLRKKNGAGGINLPDLRLSYSHQDSMVLAQKHKYRPMEQDRKPRKKTHAPMGTLFLTKEVRVYKGAKSLFNKGCWENWTAACKRMKLEHFLTPYTKINSKWIKDLNLILETIKLLEENIGKPL